MHLKIKAENPSVYENHTHYNEGDSGLDVFCPENLVVPAGATSFKVDLKIACEAFPDKEKEYNISYYLYPRSSMGAKTPLRLSNSVGIIDSGYRGNIMGIVDNLSNKDFVIQENTRLFQLCSPDLSPITFELSDRLSETRRGQGGFGSTGQ
tara:strand:+ start:778 stop:1230 length:453 start_codon:yes stop_codon:yes gene_type:complete